MRLDEPDGRVWDQVWGPVCTQVLNQIRSQP
jgi:hypothetical protein